MGHVINVDLRAMKYASRLATLREHGIGLWDVVAEAHRRGSLDSAIRNRNENDLLGLLERFPTIETIAFNGSTAGRLGVQMLGPRAAAFRILTLPSSSPAYTLPYEEKAKLWLALQPMMGRLDGY